MTNGSPGSDPTELPYSVIWSITSSIKVRSNSVLFNDVKNIETKERLEMMFANIRKNTNGLFSTDNLKYLNGTYKTDNETFFPCVFGEPSENTISYCLPYYPCKFLEYQDNDYDYKTWYNDNHTLLQSGLCQNNDIIFNEWIVHNRKKDDYSVAIYDIMLMLGCRRSEIYTPGTCSHLFNISLPYGKLTQKTENKVLTFLIVPIISLTTKKKDTKSYFRTTLSLSLILLPISSNNNEKIEVTAKDISNLDTTLSSVEDTPLSDFLKLDNRSTTTLYALLRDICNVFLKKAEIEIEGESVENQFATSYHITEAIFSNILDKGQIERLYQKGDCTPELHLELRKLVTPYAFFGNDPDCMDFNQMNITNKAKTYSFSIRLYDKHLNRLVLIYPKYIENFPTSSMKWGFYWMLFNSISLSQLDALTNSLYLGLKSISNTNLGKFLTKLEANFIEDIDEFYDFNLISSNFLEEYENLRQIDGINLKVERIKGKIEGLKTNVVIDEQRRTDAQVRNLSIISTVIAVGALIIAAFPKTIELLNSSIYALSAVWFWALPSSLLILGGAYYTITRKDQLYEVRKRLKKKSNK